MSKIELNDNVAKKALYEFKKFAREHEFWEKYKMMSKSIQEGKFINKLNNEEPIKLIQNANVFCHWPPSEHNFWQSLSRNWADLCIEHKIYRDIDYVMYYYKGFIKK